MVVIGIASSIAGGWLASARGGTHNAGSPREDSLQMKTGKELADGIRFAAERVATLATITPDWDHQLGHQWTTRDVFLHLAASSAGAAQVVPMLEGGMLTGLGTEQMGQMNAAGIGRLAEKSREDVLAQIREGMEQSAAFVETLDEADLAKVVTLGGYTWPKREIIAQIWIHHPIAHAYEASARWPIQ